MAYNRKIYLREALESVVNQTLDSKFYEIILVANFNPNIDAMGGKNIVVIYSNDPPGSALSMAMEKAKGRIIALLDDDDTWEPKKLETVFSLFSKDEELIYYHNNISFMDQSGANIESSAHSVSINKSSKRGLVFILADELDFRQIRQMLGWAMDFNNSSICFRKSSLENKIEYIRNVKASLDTSLFFASLTCGAKLCCDGRKYTKYRVHSQNISFGVNRDLASVIYYKRKFSERRLYQFKEILKDPDIVARPEIRRSIEYVMSSLQIDLCWLGSSKSRLVLFKETLNYSKYISLSQITYDMGIIILSFLFMCFPSVIRNKYLRRQ